MSDTPLTPLSEEQLSGLEGLLTKATPGEWTLWTSCSWRRFRSADGMMICEPYKAMDGHPDLNFGEWPHAEANAAIIPASVNALPSLIAEVRRSRARRPADFLRTEAHEARCGYLTASPMTGDEASLCSCGAVERAHEKWLAATNHPEKPSSQADAVREALLDAIAIIRAEIEDYHNDDCDCPLCMKVAAAGWDDMAQSPEQIVAALTPSPARDNQLPKEKVVEALRAELAQQKQFGIDRLNQHLEEEKAAHERNEKLETVLAALAHDYEATKAPPSPAQHQSQSLNSTDEDRNGR